MSTGEGVYMSACIVRIWRRCFLCVRMCACVCMNLCVYGCEYVNVYIYIGMYICIDVYR